MDAGEDGDESDDEDGDGMMMRLRMLFMLMAILHKRTMIKTMPAPVLHANEHVLIRQCYGQLQ